MFTEKLKELIEEKCNGSQKEFSIKTNIPASTVCHWLTRDIKPTYVQIIKICDCFQISADYLLGRENFATGNIEIYGEVLSRNEQEIITLFRSLDKTQQQAALQILYAAFSSTHTSKH
ncbi:MAG: hypothetical protein NC132_03220 [Corallococcus sp.]|nr:hypothetical protein [Corallococcus sp.]MCM1359515.1 hypothetical protein [Corallococcus sp.]MCM1395107.1 hypothetical protein [Corallococcus sp.]